MNSTHGDDIKQELQHPFLEGFSVLGPLTEEDTQRFYNMGYELSFDDDILPPVPPHIFIPKEGNGLHVFKKRKE